MPVELQSDLITSDFWKHVRTELLKCLANRGLAHWRVVVRPETNIDRPKIVADTKAASATIIVPDEDLDGHETGQVSPRKGKRPLTPSEFTAIMAKDFARDLAANLHRLI